MSGAPKQDGERGSDCHAANAFFPLCSVGQDARRVILLINDDGIASPGLRVLYAALRAQLSLPVLCVAPARERSGQSHAITIDRPLVVHAQLDDGFFGFAVEGTPTDCVKLALDRICPQPPRLVVSGINAGPNAGRSIFYSGTVGAALEAAIAGCPACAVSRMEGRDASDGAAAWVAERIARILAAPAVSPLVLNFNLPAAPPGEWRHLRIVRHGLGGYRERYRPIRDGSRTVWQLEGTWEGSQADDDAAALSAGHPTLSILAPDLNASDPRAALAWIDGASG